MHRTVIVCINWSHSLNRLHNKGVYLQLGVQKTFSRDSFAELNSLVNVKV